jgi:hypothetical protein
LSESSSSEPRVFVRVSNRSPLKRNLKICTASKLRADATEERSNFFSTKKSDKETARPGSLLFVLKREKK